MSGIFPIDLVAPGAFGLNTERSGTLLRPQWATTAQNAVVNRSGRLGTRKGWADQTTNAIATTPTIARMFEYVNEAGTSTVISTANSLIFKDIDDFTDAANDITSTTAPTADYWQFVNFNNKVLGFQTNHNPIARTTGDFADQSLTTTGQPGTFDLGNSAVAAFGRVWVADEDLQTIRYCVLLDDTDYSTANGGGYIDMSSIWTLGMDEIVAIAAIGANLVVFGRNHIVMWGDRSGSEIGLDPTELEVQDIIEGTGCIARDSVAVTGEGDLIFLSRHGVQSLGRVIQSKSNPTVTLSKNIRGDMQEAIAQTRSADADMKNVVAVHSPEQGLYLLNFPTLDLQFAFDTQHPFQDDDGDNVYPITKWQLGGSIEAMLAMSTGELYFGSAGVVGKYSGNDDNGSAYSFEFLSGWLDFGDPQVNHRIKMLKEILASVQVGTATCTWKWEFDFNGTQLTRSVAYEGSGAAEFNVAEFSDGGGAGVGYIDPAVGASSGETEFSGSVVIQRKNIAAHGEGQFLRVGATVPVNGSAFVIQHMSLSPKMGRMVT
jgi:hypothetical protein